MTLSPCPSGGVGQAERDATVILENSVTGVRHDVFQLFTCDKSPHLLRSEPKRPMDKLGR